MESVDQIGSDNYCLVVTRRNASEILVTAHDSLVSLPCVEILRGSRVAEQLTTEVARKWGLPTYCLFIPRILASDGTAQRSQCVLMEAIEHNDDAPQGTYWTPSAQFAEEFTGPVEDREAVEESLRELDSYSLETQVGPFGKAGWLKHLLDWSQEQLSPFGLRVGTNYRQLNASPKFSLIRLETNGPAVWFKATGEPNLHELPITLCLARLFPGFLPPIVGVHSAWNAWLSVEVSNLTLDQCTEISVWEDVMKDLAELQIASIGKSSEIVAAQCMDLRLPNLCDLISPFLNRMAELMDLQEKQCPPALTVMDLHFLRAGLQEAISHLQDLRFPDTLGHVDLNPTNILVSSPRCIFLDWAEACVTSPFITFEYLAEFVRRSAIQDRDKCDRVAASYLRPWQSFHSLDDLTRALELSPLLAVFTYAVAGSAWCSPDTLRDPSSAGFLRSLTRRMHREAVRLTERGTQCSV